MQALHGKTRLDHEELIRIGVLTWARIVTTVVARDEYDDGDYDPHEYDDRCAELDDDHAPPPEFYDSYTDPFR